MLIIIASFFSITVYNNVIDYQTNYPFIKHVMSMDTTFRTPALMHRAITNPSHHAIFYIIIVITQAISALCLWISICLLLRHLTSYTNFINAKRYALGALFIGFLLYAGGFLVIGGQWFAMWQSSNWNAQMKAGLFINLIMFVLLFINSNEHEQ